MKILIISDAIPEIKLGGTAIKDLPDGLKAKMLDLFSGLVVKRTDESGKIVSVAVKSVTVDDSSEGAVFELSDSNVSLNTLDDDVRSKFIEAMDLLFWFQGDHWDKDGKFAYSGRWHCAHCGHSQSAAYGGPSEFCPNRACPSHKTWDLILGHPHDIPSYPDQVRVNRSAEKLFSELRKAQPSQRFKDRARSKPETNRDRG